MFTSDIYKNKDSETVYISLGNYCLTSMLLKENNLKYESYPFDWMVSCIENITDIFSTDFKELLNKENLSSNNNSTKNKYYCDISNKYFLNLENDHPHHNLFDENDYNYLVRCIDRLKNVFNNYKKVIFVMIQPLYIANINQDNDNIIKLYNTLKGYYSHNDFKLLIFNINNIKNDVYSEIKLNDEVIIYELNTSMVLGNCGMMYFNNNGVNKFIEILKSYN